jgi:hypothetical protein
MDVQSTKGYLIIFAHRCNAHLGTKRRRLTTWEVCQIE